MERDAITTTTSATTGNRRATSPIRPAGKRQRQAGLTLIEILVAASILGTALMGLGYYHTNALIGVRRDGQITEANQLAISIAENWRESIRKDDSAARQYDDGASGVHTVTIAGVEYRGKYEIVPQRLNGGGQMVSVPSGQTPHLFRVEVTVAAPEAERTYSTLVFRTPDDQ